MAKLCKQRCHGVCVFFDQKSVFAIRDILSSAAAAHKDACQFTGCRLAHDKAVRVERRWEQEQIGPAVPRPNDIAVVFGRGKEHTVRKAKFVGVGHDLIFVSAAADEDHTERMAAVLKFFECVERDA